MKTEINLKQYNNSNYVCAIIGTHSDSMRRFKCIPALDNITRYVDDISPNSCGTLYINGEVLSHDLRRNHTVIVSTDELLILKMMLGNSITCYMSVDNYIALFNATDDTVWSDYGRSIITDDKKVPQHRRALRISNIVLRNLHSKFATKENCRIGTRDSLEVTGVLDRLVSKFRTAAF